MLLLIFLFFSLGSTEFCPCGYDVVVKPWFDNFTSEIVEYTTNKTTLGCGAKSLDFEMVNSFGSKQVYALNEDLCTYACQLYDTFLTCVMKFHFMPLSNLFPVWISNGGDSTLYGVEIFETYAVPKQQPLLHAGYKISGEYLHLFRKRGYGIYCGFKPTKGYQMAYNYPVYTTDDGCLMSPLNGLVPGTGVIKGRNAGSWNIGDFNPEYTAKIMFIPTTHVAYVFDIGLVPIGDWLVETPGAYSAFFEDEFKFDYVFTVDDYVIGMSFYEGKYVQYIDLIRYQDVIVKNVYYNNTDKTSSQYMYVAEPKCEDHFYDPELIGKGFEIQGSVCPYDDDRYLMVYDFFLSRPSHIASFPDSYFYEENIVETNGSSYRPELPLYHPCHFNVDIIVESGGGCQPIVSSKILEWHCSAACRPLSYSSCVYTDSLRYEVLTALPDGNFYYGYDLGPVQEKLYFNEYDLACPIVDQSLVMHPNNLSGFSYYEDQRIVGTFGISDDGTPTEGDICQVYKGIITCNRRVEGLILISSITTGSTESTLSTSTSFSETTPSSCPGPLSGLSSVFIPLIPVFYFGKVQ